MITSKQLIDSGLFVAHHKTTHTDHHSHHDQQNNENWDPAVDKSEIAATLDIAFALVVLGDSESFKVAAKSIRGILFLLTKSLSPDSNQISKSNGSLPHLEIDRKFSGKDICQFLLMIGLCSHPFDYLMLTKYEIRFIQALIVYITDNALQSNLLSYSENSESLTKYFVTLHATLASLGVLKNVKLLSKPTFFVDRCNLLTIQLKIKHLGYYITSHFNAKQDVYHNIYINSWPFILFKVIKSGIIKPKFAVGVANTNKKSFTVHEKIYTFLIFWFVQKHNQKTLLNEIVNLKCDEKINSTSSSELQILIHVVHKINKSKKWDPLFNWVLPVKRNCDKFKRNKVNVLLLSKNMQTVHELQKGRIKTELITEIDPLTLTDIDQFVSLARYGNEWILSDCAPYFWRFCIYRDSSGLLITPSFTFTSDKLYSVKDIEAQISQCKGIIEFLMNNWVHPEQPLVTILLDIEEFCTSDVEKLVSFFDSLQNKLFFGGVCQIRSTKHHINVSRIRDLKKTFIFSLEPNFNSISLPKYCSYVECPLEDIVKAYESLKNSPHYNCDLTCMDENNCNPEVYSLLLMMHIHQNLANKQVHDTLMQKSNYFYTKMGSNHHNWLIHRFKSATHFIAPEELQSALSFCESYNFAIKFKSEGQYFDFKNRSCSAALSAEIRNKLQIQNEQFPLEVLIQIEALIYLYLIVHSSDFEKVGMILSLNVWKLCKTVFGQFINDLNSENMIQCFEILSQSPNESMKRLKSILLADNDVLTQMKKSWILNTLDFDLLNAFSSIISCSESEPCIIFGRRIEQDHSLSLLELNDLKFYCENFCEYYTRYISCIFLSEFVCENDCQNLHPDLLNIDNTANRLLEYMTEKDYLKSLNDVKPESEIDFDDINRFLDEYTNGLMKIA